LTVRRAFGQLSQSITTVWRPVFSDTIYLPDKDKRGSGAKDAKDAQVDTQKGQAGYRHQRTQDAALRTQATSHSPRVRLSTTPHLLSSNVYDMIVSTTAFRAQKAKRI